MNRNTTGNTGRNRIDNRPHTLYTLAHPAVYYEDSLWEQPRAVTKASKLANTSVKMAAILQQTTISYAKLTMNTLIWQSASTDTDFAMISHKRTPRQVDSGAALNPPKCLLDLSKEYKNWLRAFMTI